jgi:hypothetical protein
MYPDFFAGQLANERQREIREIAQSRVLEDAISA